MIMFKEEKNLSHVIRVVGDDSTHFAQTLDRKQKHDCEQQKTQKLTVLTEFSDYFRKIYVFLSPFICGTTHSPPNTHTYTHLEWTHLHIEKTEA